MRPSTTATVAGVNFFLDGRNVERIRALGSNGRWAADVGGCSHRSELYSSRGREREWREWILSQLEATGNKSTYRQRRERSSARHWRSPSLPNL